MTRRTHPESTPKHQRHIDRIGELRASVSRLHLDKRADALIASASEVDDSLLTTGQTADWLGVSRQWLENARGKGFGPPFKRLAPQIVRYQRDDVVAWLEGRSYARTGDYEERDNRLLKKAGARS